MSNKYKVLMFGPGLKVMGGISSVVNEWLEAGIEQKLDLKYIPTLKDGRPGRYLGKFSDAVKAYSRMLIEIMRPVDIVHIHLSSYMSFYRKLIIFWIVKTRGIKTIVHLHGSMFKEFYKNGPAIQKNLIKWMFNKSDAIIVLSETWHQFVSEISTNSNIYIIHNGVSPKKFHTKKSINKKRITITFMGRLGKRKGTYDLIDVFTRLSTEFPDVELLLGGDGDIEEVKNLVDRKGLSNRIHVLGWLSGPEKLKVFANSDIYTLPSYNEGLPVSILEAMASGLPIVSTHVGGIPEAVIDNKNGFLVQPGDIDTLYICLSELCRSKQLRQKMGQASVELASQKFDVKELIDALITVYKNALPS